MFNLTKDSEVKVLRPYVYDFLNRYGFNDGDGILDEEKKTVEHLCHKLAKELGLVESRWKPVVVSCSHNPYYISFEDMPTGKRASFFELGERERRKIEKRIDEIMHT